MNIHTYSLGPIPLGSRQSLTIHDHDKTLDVNSDGRIDAPMLDGFHSAASIQSIKDPRVESLHKDFCTWMRTMARPEYEQKDQLDARMKILEALKSEGKDNPAGLIRANFGPSWNVGETDIRYNGCGRMSATLKEGENTLGVTVARFASDHKDIRVWVTRQEGPFVRSHSVDRDAEGGRISESACLVDTRVPLGQVFFPFML